MTGIKVSLLGKFNVTCGEKRTGLIRARKVQELFIYLLIFRHRPQPREVLSEALWVDQPLAVSRKNLRQTLWHLQSVLKELKSSSSLDLQNDDGCIHMHIPANFWLDTAEFEQVFNQVNHKEARELEPQDYTAMQHAANLYQGDLLEGWYQEWCIFERERFQVMYLMLLDKLVQYCEFQQKYDAGLAYGWQILRHDHAYERAHRQIMRLYLMSGDRTQALHQYTRCVDALRDELGIEPSARTRQLYEQIRWDTFQPPLFALKKSPTLSDESTLVLEDVEHRIEQFVRTLRSMEHQIRQEIVALESVLSHQGNQSS